MIRAPARPVPRDRIGRDGRDACRISPRLVPGTRRTTMALDLVPRIARPALALGLALSTPATGGRTPGEVEIGQTLREATIQGLNGPARRLSEFRGKPLIINVWASWCGPCRDEARSLERLAWSEAGGRYTIIGVSTDDDRQAALGWLKHSRATLTHYIDHRLTLENMLGASTIPLTVLVDVHGRVVARFRGARQWDSAESVRMIEKAYAESARRKSP